MDIYIFSAVVHSYGIMKLKDMKINYCLHIFRRILRYPFLYLTYTYNSVENASTYKIITSEVIIKNFTTDNAIKFEKN